MTKESLIAKTVKTLNVLPNDKAEEVADFADYMMKKYENDLLVAGIQKITEQGKAFNFLAEEEELYLAADIKRKY